MAPRVVAAAAARECVLRGDFGDGGHASGERKSGRTSIQIRKIHFHFRRRDLVASEHDGSRRLPQWQVGGELAVPTYPDRTLLPAIDPDPRLNPPSLPCAQPNAVVTVEKGAHVPFHPTLADVSDQTKRAFSAVAAERVAAKLEAKAKPMEFQAKLEAAAQFALDAEAHDARRKLAKKKRHRDKKGKKKRKRRRDSSSSDSDSDSDSSSSSEEEEEERKKSKKRKKDSKRSKRRSKKSRRSSSSSSSSSSSR